eukprot:1433720-Prymnesium_polylepis.1
MRRLRLEIERLYASMQGRTETLVQLAYSATNVMFMAFFGYWYQYMAVTFCLWHAIYNLMARPKSDSSMVEMVSGVIAPLHYLCIAITALTSGPSTLDLSRPVNNEPTNWAVPFLGNLERSGQINSHYLRYFEQASAPAMECGDPLHPERGVNMADLYTLYTASNTFTNITFDVLMDQGYVKWRCPWTVVDALYFAMATMTSVGYGDLTANKDAFGIMLALIGVL